MLGGAYAREYAADPYIGHSIGPVAGYGVSAQNQRVSLRGVKPESEFESGD